MLRKVVRLLLLSAVLAAGICYAQSTPEIDVQTGLVTNGPIYVNQQFKWVNRSSIVCSVSTSPTAQWFSPDPVSVPAASGGNTGEATGTATAAGTWSYSSPCLELGNNPKIPIGSH